ncbi:MAG TPA: hypothetical protein P5137_05745 [Candidatus Brocadiia bacterium]|nr:hypothetical protein [Candidatus Brocadiia bacterium]
MNATQERATAVDAVRWAVVLLAAITAWECARSLNAMVHAGGLVHADSMNASFQGVWGKARTAQGVMDQLKARAASITGVLFLASMAALAGRLCLSTSLLGALYETSPARERRGMSGFLIASFGLFAQGALIFAMASFALPGHGAHDVHIIPVLMALFLLGNAVWHCLLQAGRRPEDRQSLRGLAPAALCALVVAAGLGVCLGLIALRTPVTAAPPAGLNLAVTAAAALLLCVLDLACQSAAYGAKPGKLGGVLTAIVCLLALAAAGGAVWLNA